MQMVPLQQCFCPFFFSGHVKMTGVPSWWPSDAAGEFFQIVNVGGKFLFVHKTVWIVSLHCCMAGDNFSVPVSRRGSAVKVSGSTCNCDEVQGRRNRKVQERMEHQPSGTRSTRIQSFMANKEKFLRKFNAFSG